jgi:hypothetical protein
VQQIERRAYKKVKRALSKKLKHITDLLWHRKNNRKKNVNNENEKTEKETINHNQKRKKQNDIRNSNNQQRKTITNDCNAYVRWYVYR